MKSVLTIIIFFTTQNLYSQEDNSTPADDEKFAKVYETASFPGGLKGWGRYVTKNFKYPLEARKLGVEGRVFIQFTIEEDGSQSDAKIIQGIGAGCDEEALRLINEMPIWNPGKDSLGNPIRQRYIQNIMFKLPPKNRRN